MPTMIPSLQTCNSDEIGRFVMVCLRSSGKRKSWFDTNLIHFVEFDSTFFRPALSTTSFKSNIGHLECGAGAASFAKLLLVLHQSLIPPSLHLKVLLGKPKPHVLWIIPVGKNYMHGISTISV